MSPTAVGAKKKTIVGESELVEHAREHHGYEGEDDYGAVKKHFLEKGLCPVRIGDVFVFEKW